MPNLRTWSRRCAWGVLLRCGRTRRGLGLDFRSRSFERLWRTEVYRLWRTCPPRWCATPGPAATWTATGSCYGCATAAPGRAVEWKRWMPDVCSGWRTRRSGDASKCGIGARRAQTSVIVTRRAETALAGSVRRSRIERGPVGEPQTPGSAGHHPLTRWRCAGRGSRASGIEAPNGGPNPVNNRIATLAYTTLHTRRSPLIYLREATQ